MLTLAVLLTNVIFIQTFAQVSTENDTTDFSNASPHIKKPYVIVISAYGFRYDYAEKYHAKNILALSAKGIRAKYMIPSYPSVTHPNHYAVSGLYPGHSGIVGNSFYDPATAKKYKGNDGAFFGGEPVWVTESSNLQSLKTLPDQIIEVFGVIKQKSRQPEAAGTLFNSINLIQLQLLTYYNFTGYDLFKGLNFYKIYPIA